MDEPLFARNGIPFPKRGLLIYCACAWLILLAFFHRSFIYGELLSPAELLSQRAVTSISGKHEPGNRLLTDSVYQFMVWQKKGFDSFAVKGTVPFIDQDILCGAPFYCNPQAEPFYLPRQLTPPSVFPRLNALVHAFELFLAGLGIYLFVWALGLGAAARCFGGLLWMLNGFLVAWMLWPLSAAAWPFSWMLFSTQMILRRGGRVNIWGGVLALSVFLSFCGGHPQTTCMILLFTGTYALLLCCCGSRLLIGKASDAFKWGAFVVLGGGLSAFFLLPQLLYLKDSFAWVTRVGKHFSLFAFSRPDIVSLPGFFFPEIFGGFRSGELPLCDIVKALNPNELAGGYVGWLVPLVMFPVAFIRRREIPFFYFWAVWALAGLMVALNLPLIVNLVEAVPVIGSIRLTRFIMLSGISFLIPAVYAVDSLSRTPLSRKSFLAICLLLGVFALTSLCAGAVFRMSRGIIIEKVIEPRRAAMAEKLADSPTLSGLTPLDFAKHLEATTVWYPWRCSLIAAMVLLALLYGASRGKYAYYPLVAAAVFELFCFGYGYTPSIKPGLHYPETPAIDFLKRNTGGFKVAADGEKILPANVFSYYGIADIRGFDSIGYPPYFELMMKTVKLDRSENAFTRHSGYLHPVCDLMGMKYLVSDRLTEPQDAAIARFKRVFSGKGFNIYENMSVLPEVYLAERVVVEPDRGKQLDVLDVMKPGERIAVISSGPVVQTGKGTASLVEKTDRTIRIKAFLESPGFLVASFIFVPGWKAELNTHVAMIDPTNYAFMGLRLPAGDSDIKLSYSPPGLRTGIMLSVASLLALLLLSANSLFRHGRV